MNSQAMVLPTWSGVRLALNSSTTTAQISTAESTDSEIAQLTRLIRRSSTRSSPSQRSCSAPRLARSRGSMSRERSTIRDRREVQTFTNEAIPLSRNTGATVIRTTSATVVTERMGEPSNMCRLIGRAPRARKLGRGALPFAARDLEQKQAVDDEARADEPREAGDQPMRRTEDADHDRRDRKAGDQQHRQKQVHPRGKRGPDADRSSGLEARRREDDAADQQPCDHQDHRRKEM